MTSSRFWYWIANKLYKFYRLFHLKLFNFFLKVFFIAIFIQSANVSNVARVVSLPTDTDTDYTDYDDDEDEDENHDE